MPLFQRGVAWVFNGIDPFKIKLDHFDKIFIKLLKPLELRGGVRVACDPKGRHAFLFGG